MVNHVRTLLLNRTRDAVPRDFPGEAYIPETFQVRQLTGPVADLHGRLFGMDSDRLFRNYRLFQWLTILHATELEPLVFWADPRVTYLPLAAERRLWEDAFRPSSVHVAGPLPEFFIHGEYTASPALPLSEVTWQLEATGPDEWSVTRIGSTQTVVQTIASQGGLQGPITLPGTAVRVSVRAVPVGTVWRLTLRGRPQESVAAIVSALLADRPATRWASLWSGTDETVQTLGRVVRSHPDPLCRIAALLLSLARKIEEFPEVRV